LDEKNDETIHALTSRWALAPVFCPALHKITQTTFADYLERQHVAQLKQSHETGTPNPAQQNRLSGDRYFDMA
jgi:hypothetical protein